MPLRHTEPEYTIKELKELISNEINIDDNKVDVNSFIEYIVNRENNLNAVSDKVVSITTNIIEEKATKVKDFLDIDKFVEFIIGNKINKASFYNSESEELSGNISFENVLDGLTHSYDEDIRSLKKDD